MSMYTQDELAHLGSPTIPWKYSTEEYKPGPKILGAMKAITAEMKSIPKTNTNSFQKYNFRSIAQAMAALQPLLIKHDVVLQPEILDREVHMLEKGCMVLLTYQLTFWHVSSGESFTVSMTGQGADSGDKAASKAEASGFKYCIFHAFCIPEDGVDSEFHNPEVQKKSSAAVEKKKPTTYDLMR